MSTQVTVVHGGLNPNVAQRALASIAVALMGVNLLVALDGARQRDDCKVSAEQLQLRIDPNRATAAELELLPGIGPTLAARIIAYRENAGAMPAFRQPEDLDRVPRIGPATVARLRPYLQFSADGGESGLTAGIP